MYHFIEAFIFLTCAVLVVPLFRRLGSVIGYLVAGTLVGPYCLGLFSDVSQILEVSKLGVVLLLFIIGLELEPRRLWALRVPVFGVGGLQLIATALLILIPVWLWRSDFTAAVTIAFALALSSTAFALQIITERNQLLSSYGKNGFSVLLFQDMALLPLLALLPMLSSQPNDSEVPAYMPIFALIVAILLMVVGSYFTRPLFRFVAQSRNPELFTATALLVAIGTAWMVGKMGLPMSLGAFLAGVLLADSEFKHEIESHIEPFKGLLLGLFFIAVGMALDWSVVVQKPVAICLGLFMLLLIKCAVLYVLGRSVKLSVANSLLLAATLSQGGEFAFVLFAQADELAILDKSEVSFWSVVVTLSMICTPFLLLIVDSLIVPRLAEEEEQPEYDTEFTEANPVIIAGFGRFGQIIARILRLKQISFTALESDFKQVDFVRKYGDKIYFGDATRLELLKSARADQARVLVVAVDDVKTSLQIISLASRNFPHLKIYVRARDREHVRQLVAHNVDGIVRETFLSSLETTRLVLESLGLPSREADKTVRDFRAHDEELLLTESDADIAASDVPETVHMRPKSHELESLYQQDESKLR